MKVKLYVCRHEEVEVEIDDKFRKIAVPRPWEDKTLPEGIYDECISAVARTAGLPFGDEGCAENYIVAVHSAENGETMLEW